MITVKERVQFYYKWREEIDISFGLRLSYGGKAFTDFEDNYFIELYGPCVIPKTNPLKDHLLWGILLHELGHIRCGHHDLKYCAALSSGLSQSDIFKMEQEANQWAKEFDPYLFMIPHVRSRFLKALQSYQPRK